MISKRNVNVTLQQINHQNTTQQILNIFDVSLYLPFRMQFTEKRIHIVIVLCNGSDNDNQNRREKRNEDKKKAK